MQKKLFLGEYVILPEQFSHRFNSPQRCLFSIQSGIFSTIQILTRQIDVISTQISELTQQAQLRYFKNELIIPGLIECNTTTHPQWESVSQMTKRALQGGITTLMVEKNLDQIENLFTDILLVQTLQGVFSGFLEHRKVYKMYLDIPSWDTQDLQNWDQVFSSLQSVDSTLIIDCNLPDSNHGFMNSPLRVEPIEKRNTQKIPTINIFAANLNTKEEESGKQQSDQEVFGLLNSDTTKSSFSDSLSPGLTQLENSIRKRKNSKAELIQAQLKSYQSAGTTVYKPSETQKPKMHFSKMRPPFLTLVQKPTSDSYMDFLLNYPDRYQTNGVKQVLKMLQQFKTIKVHFANISASQAVLEINSARPLFNVSLQTSIHYLYYSTINIKPNDTRFKINPPIRSESNRKELWGLIKGGVVDCISGMHEFVDLTYKYLELQQFKRALPGIPSLGYTLSALWTSLVGDELECSREQLMEKFTSIVHLMSVRVAERFGVNGGCIKEGMPGTFVVFDLDALTRNKGYLGLESPYSEQGLKGDVKEVYIRGRKVFGEEKCKASGCFV